MTISNDTQLSFGLYLQECRKNKNLTLNFIARELKIGVGVLAAIENEDLSMMPDKVFAKGFLRGFAKIVGADEGRVIHDYLERIDQLNGPIQPNHNNPTEEKKSLWAKLALSALVVLLVIFLTVFVLSGPADQTPEDRETVPADAALSADGDSVDLNNEVSVDTGQTSSSAAIPEKIQLSIITAERTWIKIIIDNEKAKEYMLQPGDHLDLDASNKYNLLIGNAAGIKLFANGVPVELPREAGKVINIEIP